MFFTSVGNLDGALANKNVVKLLRQPTKQTYESATSNDYILGIRKETHPRILSLLIISKAEPEMLSATYQGLLF